MLFLAPRAPRRRVLAPLDADEQRRHKLRNMAQSVLLLGGMALLVAVCGWILFGPIGLIGVAVVVVIALTFGSKLSAQMVLRMYKAERLSPAQLPDVFRIIEHLTRRAGLEKMPALYYVPSSMMNAFAVGRREEAVIGVTDGLLRALNLRELTGVLAHEMSHIRNNDVWLMGMADLASRLTRIMSLAGGRAFAAQPAHVAAGRQPRLLRPDPAFDVRAADHDIAPAGALARSRVRCGSGCRRADRRSGRAELGAGQAGTPAAREIDRYASVPGAAARECVGFVFGIERGLKLDLLRRYRDAKRDLDAGRGLPPEVLEGIRATYHKHLPSGRALELGRGAMTNVQRMRVQRSADAAGVKVEFDPRKVDAVRLYVYAFERGVDDSIAEALDAKAREVAESLPFEIEHAGILLDASASMAGSSEQAMRPIASALALRDLLQAKARRASMVTSGGCADGRLVRPEGATSLARGLVQLLRLAPDVVFVLTDGYENAPAGRFDETLDAVRELGIDTPVYQISPLFGAEANGLRALAPAGALALPIAAPESFGLAYVRGLVENDPKKGIRALLRG